MPKWNVEFAEEFGFWWDDLNDGEKEDIRAIVNLLRALGPFLPFPHTSGISQSKHGQMRELRIQHKGAPYRILYAFDPTRTAFLLIGGNKKGDKRWYKKNIPHADKIFSAHLSSLKKEKK